MRAYPPSISLPGLTCCRITVSPTQKIPHIAGLILADSSHVLRPLMQRRYENVLDRRKHHKQKGLQLIVTANSLGKHVKSVVRNWARRRLEQAIAAKLRENGFDGGGRSLRKGHVAAFPSQQNAFGSPTSSRNLEGYVNIQLMDGILQIKATELQQQAAIIVDEVLRLNQRP